MILSIFPKLFTYSIFAITLIRIFSAFIFIKIALKRKNKKEKKLFFIPEILVSIFLLIGLYTQVAVLILWIFVMVEKYFDKKEENNKTSSDTLILLEVCLISLLFLGPGAFSVDVPL